MANRWKALWFRPRMSKTFTTSVFTDEGNYFFPQLDNGQYRVWAQAVGYEAERAESKLDHSKETRQDFTLKTIDDFTSQLSGSEWLAALPSDTPQNRRMKEIFNLRLHLLPYAWVCAAK